eukprot:g82374.t1
MDRYDYAAADNARRALKNLPFQSIGISYSAHWNGRAEQRDENDPFSSSSSCSSSSVSCFELCREPGQSNNISINP